MGRQTPTSKSVTNKSIKSTIKITKPIFKNKKLSQKKINSSEIKTNVFKSRNLIEPKSKTTPKRNYIKKSSKLIQKQNPFYNKLSKKKLKRYGRKNEFLQHLKKENKSWDNEIFEQEVQKREVKKDLNKLNEFNPISHIGTIETKIDTIKEEKDTEMNLTKKGNKKKVTLKKEKDSIDNTMNDLLNILKETEKEIEKERAKTNVKKDNKLLKNDCNKFMQLFDNPVFNQDPVNFTKNMLNDKIQSLSMKTDKELKLQKRNHRKKKKKIVGINVKNTIKIGKKKAAKIVKKQKGKIESQSKMTQAQKESQKKRRWRVK